jgi:hypothetical protein
VEVSPEVRPPVAGIEEEELEEALTGSGRK